MKSESPLQVGFDDVFGGAASGAAAGASLGPWGAVGGAIVGGVGGYFKGKANDELESQQQEAKDKFQKDLDAFASAPIKNPFENMTNQFAGLKNELANVSTDNKAEDLTVNLKSADMQRQMASEDSARVMNAAKAGAGGAGGIAAIANLMSQQNSRIRQQIGADIGQQESRNQQLKVQGAEAARGVQMASAQEGNRINQAIAQGAASVQSQQAKGQMQVNQMQQEKDSLVLGFNADMYASNLGSLQGQMGANEEMLTSGLGALGNMAGSLNPPPPTDNTGGTVINVNSN